MGNIRNHNHFPFDLTPVKSDYWDFFLYLHQCGWSGFGDWYHTGCLAAMIDTAIDECVTDDGLESLGEYVYSKCKSKGLELNNIGFTGTDNGKILFDKYTITSEEFSDLLKNSNYTVPEGDCKLKIYPVSGNTKLYDYSWSIVEEDGVRCVKLNGGFFQGIYASGDTCTYSVLPNKLDRYGWSLDFEIKRKDFGNACRRLNDTHPENKGIFFYMGTRAENKWARYYDTDCEFEDNLLTNNDVLFGCECNLLECAQEEYYPKGYISGSTCEICEGSDEFKPEIPETNGESADVRETNSGHSLSIANLVEIETDNKYAFFDRSCNGITTLTYEEGDKAVIQYRLIKNDANYFPIFNRSCNGLTAKDYDKYLEENGNKYNIYKDLYNNAFALQVKDDGSVGYKYFVRDCDAENPDCAYKIESEFTNIGVVEYGKWSNVHVRINRLGNSKRMNIMIYVNGRLRLVSKELPIFDFRLLDDMEDKQEGVPYNISLGGGTQGLCEVIYNDYANVPEKLYPLEKEFGGTFFGYIKSFKFYECSINYNNINQNTYTLRYNLN